MNQEQHMEHFYKEKDKIIELHISNQIERDKTVLNLSTFSLAILAGFGNDILIVNKILAVAIIVLFTVTILIQMAGFFVTGKNALAASENMDRNVMEGRRFFDPGYSKTEWSKLMDVMNITSMTSFVSGFILLAVLMIQTLFK